MEVICELMRLRPEFIQEYIGMHKNTPSDLIDAVLESGYKELHIFIFSNLVIVIFRCKDFEESKRKLANYSTFKKWTNKVQSMLETDKQIFPINDRLIDLKPIWNLDNYKK